MSTMREAMGEIYDKLAAEGGGPAEAGDRQVVGGDSGDIATEPAIEPARGDSHLAADKSGGPEQADSEGGDSPTGQVSRARDESGRFAKGQKAKPKAEAAPAPNQGEQTQTQAPAVAKPDQTKPPAPGEATPTPAPKFRAPQSWKPTARERWAALPEEIQAEVDRRERETATALSETAQVRQFHQQFQQTIAPYQTMIMAGSGDPLKTVGNLMQTAAKLQFGSPVDKAHLVAQMVQSFGVPIDALDAALSGQAQQSPTPDYRDPRVDQLFQMLEGGKQQRQQAQAQRIQSELATFAEKNEFYEDVRNEMSAIISASPVEISLDEAYSRAVWANPSTRAILQERDKAKLAQTTQAATERAKAASSTVKSQPATPMNGAAKARTTRDAVAAAYEELSGR